MKFTSKEKEEEEAVGVSDDSEEEEEEEEDEFQDVMEEVEESSELYRLMLILSPFPISDIRPPAPLFPGILIHTIHRQGREAAAT